VSALIWSPFGDAASAELAAKQMLDEGLVACANIFPPMRSLYLWQGEFGEGPEVAVLFKTDASLLERATERLAEIHPYQTPAVLGWRADAVPAPTAEWLGALANRETLR
jgi:periplasmic divalent cation tolerance protein